MLAARALLAIAAPLVMVALSGCREEPQPRAAGGAPAVGAGQALAQQSAARAEQVCRLLQGGPAERRAACCGGSGAGHVEAQCVRVLGEALAAGRVAIDEGAMSRCSAALPSALAGCDWVTPGQPLPPDECRSLTRGLVSAGGACRSSLECTGALHCEGSTPTQAGRCSPPLPGGAACRAPSDNLASLLFARELESAHPRCAGRTQRASAARSGTVLPGGSCSTDFDCQRGGCTAGVCGAKCALSMADVGRPSSLPPLVLPRRSPAR